MTLKIVRSFAGEELTEDLEQKPIKVDRFKDTYTTLLQESFKLFEITDPAVQATYRLRSYNVHNRIMGETYKGGELKSLEELRIYPYRTLILEQKQAGIEFEDYDPTLITIKINLFREGIESLSESELKPV